MGILYQKNNFQILIQVLDLFLIQTLLFIGETRDQIYNKYIKDNKDNFKPIKIKGDLTLKKEKVNDIIKGIKNVNKFSDEKRCYQYISRVIFGRVF